METSTIPYNKSNPTTIFSIASSVVLSSSGSTKIASPHLPLDSEYFSEIDFSPASFMNSNPILFVAEFHLRIAFH